MRLQCYLFIMNTHFIFRLILKMEHRFKVFTMKGIATNLVNQENNFKAFEIDENTFIQFCKGDK